MNPDPMPSTGRVYTGDNLGRVAFPLGGIGAGMLALEGAGGLSQVSVRNRPELGHEPLLFAAISMAPLNQPQGASRFARVLQGPVPDWKLLGRREAALGIGGSANGLPRFGGAAFRAAFPFASVTLMDPASPCEVTLTGWSPFVPGQADDSSLPVAALEYRFANRSAAAVEAVFSFNAANFAGYGLPARAIKPAPGGFTLWGAGASEKPWQETAFSVMVDEPDVQVDHAWFRGAWWDHLVMLWRDIESGACPSPPPATEGEAPPGASLFVPFQLAPGEVRTISVRLAWYAGITDLRFDSRPVLSGAPVLQGETHRPWYAGRFAGIDEVAAFWRVHRPRLRAASLQFSRCLHDSSLPPEVVEAVAANLSILKSPTVLRQADGRLWAWEGSNDHEGSCPGSCTHVWNYAQAIPHLFPDLERTLRESEFEVSQDERGHQMFRTALPIRPTSHDFHSAADGQLGGIMKVFREWRISGDTAWLRRLWPRVRQSLDYCIATWDPAHRGCLEEPWHNTYDIEFWGPDGLSSTFYLGALRAAVAMGTALGEDVTAYARLQALGQRVLEQELFDGEYFFQRVEWQNKRAGNPLELASLTGGYSPEAAALALQEGPRYQYGRGCLSDGVLGAWLAAMCGVGDVAAPDKIASHLDAVYRHNFKPDLSGHACAQRYNYAHGTEGGLLLCSWPKGGRPARPLVYADEVWTGIEYQVASHLFLHGRIEAGLSLVRATRARYDGRLRNPFDEFECGHWYARALSSYGLFQGLTGARYDAVDGVLHLAPSIAGDFRSFLSWAGGYGTVGVREGRPFLDVKAGAIDLRRIAYLPCPNSH